MKAVIELVCRAHVERDGVGPLITPLDGVWAYCAGRAAGDHDWAKIPPTRRVDLPDSAEMGDGIARAS